MSKVFSATTSNENPKPQAFLHLFVKSKKKESPGFHKDDFLHSINTEKDEILNDQFKSVYTQEDLHSLADKGLKSISDNGRDPDIKQLQFNIISYIHCFQ